MGGGAWPFLVGGVICLVNSVNERDDSLLTSRANPEMVEASLVSRGPRLLRASGADPEGIGVNKRLLRGTNPRLAIGSLSQ